MHLDESNAELHLNLIVKFELESNFMILELEPEPCDIACRPQKCSRVEVSCSNDDVVHNKDSKVM